MARRSPPQNDQEARHGPGTDRSENEAPPTEQRSPEIRSPKSEGPLRGPANELLPSVFTTKNGILREDR